MSRPLARIALSLPVIVATVLIFFAAGTWLGGQYLVPEGQGLAAAAEAMGYGLLAGLLGLLVSIIAAVRLPMKALLACALAGSLAIAGLAVFVSQAALNANEDVPDTSNQPQTRPEPTGQALTGEGDRA